MLSRNFDADGFDNIIDLDKIEEAEDKNAIGFIFDIIVVRLDVPNQTFENPNELSVDVVFNKVNLHITSSRINVVEFRSGRSYEFNAVPLVLKEELKRTPLELTLKYLGQQLGKGKMYWPESFTCRITDCGGELTHCNEAELKDDVGTKIGSVEVIIRLQTKCKEYIEDYTIPQRKGNICKEMDKVIDPNDILFVVGEDKSSCCCTQVGIIPASDSEKSINPTCLDLSSFRPMNGKTITSPDVLNSLNGGDQMKKVANQYKQLVDSLIGSKANAPCCSKRQTYQTSNLKIEKSCATFSSSDSYEMTCQYSHNGGEFGADKIVHICPDITPPELVQNTYHTPRYCIVCKENITWLPKLAACPKCGYKPIPQVEEKQYDDKLTAEQILQEYIEKQSSAPDDNSIQNCEDAPRECRCTCKNGKICAHCRIKKLCEDIFQPNVKSDVNCNNCETDENEVFNVCQESGKDCRPYLARVFSELRDLYDIKGPKAKEFELSEKCEKELNYVEKPRSRPEMTSMTSTVKHDDNPASAADSNTRTKRKRRRRKRDDMENERKKFLVKNFKKSEDACKSKIYNYRSVRSYPGTQIGHKTCVNGFAAGRKNVPSNMGWLWNVEAKGNRAGWKPGAIRKPIKELMKYFLKDFPADTLRVSQYSYRKKCEEPKESKEELVQKPTLHIFKKNGEYTITMRPLKDSEALKHCADPYLDMKPIQFKITKHPIAAEIRKLKTFLKDLGFKKCTCHKPIVYCYCRSFIDKKRLEYQCNKECRRRNLPVLSEKLVLSDTTDSDVEFDFGVTPPAGVIKPGRGKKPDLVNHGTQYVEGDWNVTPIYPKEPNKYMKLYNCAIGERFGKTFGPYGPSGYAPGAPPAPNVFTCDAAGGGRGKKRGGPGGGRFLGIGRNPLGARVGGGGGPDADDKNAKNDGKVDMMKYLKQKSKASKSPSQMKREAEEKRKKRMEMPPPILCMIDRRGKPIDPCAPCVPNICCDEYGYYRDSRIC